MRICQWRDGCTNQGTELRTAMEKTDQGEDWFEVYFCPDHAADVDVRIKNGQVNLKFLLMTLGEPIFHQKVEEPEDQ